MSVYINAASRIITQGITGRAGRLYTERCLRYAAGRECFVAGVHPAKTGQEIFGLPIYASVREAAAATGATVSVIYVPPAAAAAAIMEAVEADVELVICLTHGVPVRDMLQVRSRMRAREAAGARATLLLGPDSPGIISPGALNIGGLPDSIHRPGRIGVVSRSGTLACEAVLQLREHGLGQSSVVGLGGDIIGGLDFVDVMRAFNDDEGTDAVVMIGEIGGRGEIDAALWCREHMDKPVIAFIAGAAAPVGRRLGHGGAFIARPTDSAAAKKQALQECGVHVACDPWDIGALAARVVRRQGAACV